MLDGSFYSSQPFKSALDRPTPICIVVNLSHIAIYAGDKRRLLLSSIWH